MGRGLHIIHLSDLHIGTAEEGESRPVFEGLRKKLAEFRQSQGVTFDLLLISGDMVNLGSRNYAPVEARINEILDAAHLTKEQVFLAPGNHDVVWEDCRDDTYQAVIKELTRQPEKLDGLDQGAVERMSRGFGSYLRFAEQFPLLRQNPSGLPGYARADVTLAGISARLLALNSALVAGPLDAAKRDQQLQNRVVARHVLADMLGEDNRLHLVVSHYPLSWIHKIQRHEVVERLQTESAILFHGHVHEPDISTAGINKDAQLLVIGAGAIYGKKWFGRNQCQILALDPSRSSPLLYEWFWFGRYGWRGFEPMEISWTRWPVWRARLGPPEVAPINLAQKCNEVGLLNIGHYQSDAERIEHFQGILHSAAEGSELIIVGRSLIDWSIRTADIAEAINSRKLHAKLALLDENSLPDKTAKPDGEKNQSWIEMPIAADWAMHDVPGSMDRFRQIKVKQGTGSLEIYGLPFYVSRSFVAYTRASNTMRYCLEEVGMALPKEQRPFIELCNVASDSYASSLERLYRSFMTEDRLLLRDDGEIRSRDTTRRAKLLINKIERYGLADLAVGRDALDWPPGTETVEEKIDNTPDGGEIFIVGRSLVDWVRHGRPVKLAEAIVRRGVRCALVIADPRCSDLKSLVKDDYAERDLRQVGWPILSEEIPGIIKRMRKEYSVSEQEMGSFEVYGIRGYIPVTFALYTRIGGLKYCSLEVGIGVPPEERTILYFQKGPNHDIYWSLNRIYRTIKNGDGGTLLLRIPEKGTRGGDHGQSQIEKT